MTGVANSASTLTATANNGTITQTVTIASAARVNGFWIKRVGGTGTIEITDNNFTSTVDVTASLSSAVYTWHTTSRTQANPVFGIRMGTSGDVIEVDFVGLEEGSYATYPLPVGASAVTRNRDILGTTDVSWFPTSAGTVYFKGQSNHHSSSSNFLLQIDDNSANDRLYFRETTSSRVQTLSQTSSGNALSATPANGRSVDAQFQYAVRYTTDDGISCLDGTLSSQDTACDFPLNDTITNFRVGAFHSTTLEWDGFVETIEFFSDAKIDAELQALTT